MYKKVTSHLFKSLSSPCISRTSLPVIISSFLPAEPKCLSDEAKDVCVFQDGLGGGFPCTVPTAGVHPDHQRLTLRGAAAHSVLQGSTIFEGVERHHAIIVICCQKQDGGVGRTRVRWRRQIMERRVPGEKVRKSSWKETWGECESGSWTLARDSVVLLGFFGTCGCV